MLAMTATAATKPRPADAPPPRGRETPKAKLEFRPVDLDRHPTVDALLVRLGLGPFQRDSVRAPVGRNDSWAGRTASGRAVIVKRLLGPVEDARARIDRLVAFERLVAGRPPLAGHAPTFIGVDRDERLVVHEYVADATSGAELVVDESFGLDLAERVGRVIGLLHGVELAPDTDVDRSLPTMPETGLLRGLPWEMFHRLSAAELEAWRLMQQDTELVAALTRLRAWERAAPRVPSHCDLRVDQLLVAGDRLYLTDWEEFRLADPARDVGSFAGEWLHRSVLDIVTPRGDDDSAFMDLEFTHEQVLRRGTAKMERLLPRFHSFYRGYRSVRTDLDAGFALRVTAYAGWHLLDRLMAGATRSNRLSGIERAAAGIGRRAVLHPERFVAVLGLEEA